MHKKASMRGQGRHVAALMLASPSRVVVRRAEPLWSVAPSAERPLRPSHGLCDELLHLADACVERQVDVLLANVNHQAANDVRLHRRLHVQRLALLQQLLQGRLGGGELGGAQRLRRREREKRAATRYVSVHDEWTRAQSRAAQAPGLQRATSTSAQVAPGGWLAAFCVPATCSRADTAVQRFAALRRRPGCAGRRPGAPPLGLKGRCAPLRR